MALRLNPQAGGGRNDFDLTVRYQPITSRGLRLGRQQGIFCGELRTGVDRQVRQTGYVEPRPCGRCRRLPSVAPADQQRPISYRGVPGGTGDADGPRSAAISAAAGVYADRAPDGTASIEAGGPELGRGKTGKRGRNGGGKEGAAWQRDLCRRPPAPFTRFVTTSLPGHGARVVPA